MPWAQGGRAFKSPRPDHPYVTDLFALFDFGAPSAPVANWGVLGFPEALTIYNFIYSRFPSTAGSGLNLRAARRPSPSSGCFVGRKGFAPGIGSLNTTASGRIYPGKCQQPAFRVQVEPRTDPVDPSSILSVYNWDHSCTTSSSSSHVTAHIRGNRLVILHDILRRRSHIESASDSMVRLSLISACAPERPGAVKGAPVFGAA